MLPNDFVKGCKNQFVHVRLRNGDFYSGIFEDCDHIMNFVLTSATLYKCGSDKEIELDRAMVRGGSIQFISLPSDITKMVRSKRADVNYPIKDKQRGHYNNRGGGGGGEGQKRQNYDNSNNNYRPRGGQGNRGRGGHRGYNERNNFVYTPENK